MNKEYLVVLFYKYAPLDNPEHVRDAQRQCAERLNLKGRVLVASEGINGTLEGERDAIDAYVAWMKEDLRFADIDFKTSKGTGSSFPKLKVKVREEIVASRLGSDVDPAKDTGTYLRPDELHRWYEEGRTFTVIDMRNSFEFQSGRFKNSIDPGMRFFRDLPEKLQSIEDLKSETVVTVCTGGVRCEKASAFLKQKGFKDVYQLEGGMHRYIEKHPEGYFEGGLYVFDGRIVMDTVEGEREIIGTCSFCCAQTEEYADNPREMPSTPVLCCDDCLPEQRFLRRTPRTVSA